MDDIKVGTLYLFKGEKSLTKDIVVSKKVLDKIFSNPKYNGAVLNIYTEEDNFSLTCEGMYDKYVKEGYSVITECDGIFFKDGQYRKLDTVVTCLLAKDVNKDDIDNIYMNFKSLENKYSPSNSYVYCLEEDDYGINYRHYRSSINKKVKSSDILKVLLKKKVNDLNDFEKEMFKKYETFNLEEILTVDNESLYPLINTSNAGASIITKNFRYDSTLKSGQHGLELKKMMKFLYPDYDSSKKNIKEMVLYNNDVLIQHCLNEIIIWLPNKMNDYQIEELEYMLDEIYHISNKTNKSIDIWACECVDTDIRSSIEINDLEAYLNNLKNKSTER